MKTIVGAGMAAALVALATPAVALAGDEHAKDAGHACAGEEHAKGAAHDCGHATTGTVTAGDAAAKGDKVVIPVAGMHCGMCAQRVTTALANVKGVKFVETSLDAKQAVIVYDRAKAKRDALAAAIKTAGYEPGTPKAN